MEKDPDHDCILKGLGYPLQLNYWNLIHMVGLQSEPH